MSNEIAIKTQSHSVGLTNTEGFELGLRVAKMMASSTLVPKEYQGNIANCAIALNMSARIGADPLQVMQSLVVIHGRPSWSATFLIATFNQCGRFTSIRYRFSGTGDDYGCVAWATEKETGDVIESSRITIQLAKDEGWYGRNGSKWKTMSQQMLMYRSASWLVRAYAPELSMGLQTAEEMHDVFDAAPTRNGSYEVPPAYDINAKLREQPRYDESADTQTGEIIDVQAGDKPGESKDLTRDIRNEPEYADWRTAIDDCKTAGELASLMNTMPQGEKIALRAVLNEKIKAAAGAK